MNVAAKPGKKIIAIEFQILLFYSNCIRKIPACLRLRGPTAAQKAENEFSE